MQRREVFYQLPLTFRQFIVLELSHTALVVIVLFDQRDFQSFAFLRTLIHTKKQIDATELYHLDPIYVLLV